MKTTKAKPKRKAARKPLERKVKAKPQMPAETSLKSRLEAEFAQAVWSAKAYMSDPSRLRALFQDAARQAATIPKEPFKDTWPYFLAMLRLIRAYYHGEYRVASEATLVVITAAIIYLVSPLDVIPDAIPTIGYLDDATVLALALKRTRGDLDDFMAWEVTTS